MYTCHWMELFINDLEYISVQEMFSSNLLLSYTLIFIETVLFHIQILLICYCLTYNNWICYLISLVTTTLTFSVVVTIRCKYILNQANSLWSNIP